MHFKSEIEFNLGNSTQVHSSTFQCCCCKLRLAWISIYICLIRISYPKFPSLIRLFSHPEEISDRVIQCMSDVGVSRCCYSFIFVHNPYTILHARSDCENFSFAQQCKIPTSSRTQKKTANIVAPFGRRRSASVSPDGLFDKRECFEFAMIIF